MYVYYMHAHVHKQKQTKSKNTHKKISGSRSVFVSESFIELFSWLYPIKEQRTIPGFFHPSLDAVTSLESLSQHIKHESDMHSEFWQQWFKSCNDWCKTVPMTQWLSHQLMDW